jgi:hypothetical protein
MSKRRKLLILLSVCIVSLSVGALFFVPKKTIKKPTTDDFDALMGKEHKRWEYVQTKEDRENLSFFRKIYEANKLLLTENKENVKVPKVVHFIWLGPKPFPRESVENVRSWMGKHPDWTFKFWSDRVRPLPCPGMELHLVKDFHFLSLADCFEKADNYAEKSDVLRYEILFQEGGIYADHDVKCFKSFDAMNASYDFFCGMDMPFTSSLPSCIFPTNNLIGVTAGHPILKTCMESLRDQWDKIGCEYPGESRDEMLNRTLHRTFYLFGQAVKEKNNTQGKRDIVFPAYYFDAPAQELAMWAYHFYSGTWHETENKFEKMVRERLMILTKKTNKLFLILGCMGGLNLICFGLLFYLLRAKRVRTHAL